MMSLATRNWIPISSVATGTAPVSFSRIRNQRPYPRSGWPPSLELLPGTRPRLPDGGLLAGSWRRSSGRSRCWPPTYCRFQQALLAGMGLMLVPRDGGEPEEPRGADREGPGEKGARAQLVDATRRAIPLRPTEARRPCK
jgi:hypothetical protein